jgi:thioredoxin reductase
MPVNYNERVEQVTPLDKGFVVRTNRAEYRSANVLLALGRGGTPRELGVPGEDLPKVVYRLTDAEQYRGQAVLVVGGGDSAIEAAVSLAAEPDTRVTLSYRGDAFGRVKPKNRDRLAEAERDGRLTVVLNSTIALVEERRVALDHKGERLALDNDTVIVCAGGILPTAMLKAMGVEVETKYGSA